MIKNFCTQLRIIATTLVVIITGNNFVNAQACGPAYSYNYIDINNIRARINNGGDMFINLSNSMASFNVPKVTDPTIPKKHTISVSSLWIGAYSKGYLKAAAMTYRQSGVDFFAGPVDTINATTVNEDCQKWDKIWRVNRTTIDSFKAGLFNSSIPADIRDWPAHGDAGKGHTKYLAPFVDVDKDGNYNPQNGDYPLIKGDQMLWWVFNDKGNLHGETGAEQIGVEIHASAYAFNQPQDTPLNHTIFVEYKIFNRSKDRLDSVYVGNFTDLDLGYAFDDYVGADSALSAYYVYNGDGDDEGLSGYGINPPSQAVILLNRQLNNFMYYNNTNQQTMGNPSDPLHFYNYLAGRWKDGKKLTYGGNGRTMSNIPANYMFPGNPTSTDPNDWNEKTAGNAPGDRRGLGSTGPFSIEPKSMEAFTYAYVYTRNTEGGSAGAVNQLKRDLVNVKNFYNKNIVTTVNEPLTTLNRINVFPNPANEQIFISSGNLFTTSIRLINAVGQEVVNLKNIKTTLNSVSVKELPTGFYTLIVETENGTEAKKLIISR